ncbi:MAG: mandelate racemase/muconate lactonizing enzyme family protein [Verrucomicrobia bacterium]|nr:mandelate racemase/muconate lactonizing enzyme family protein [Verrucomicrobiota bacterium]MDA1067042.1 mandelate racemase/muconate lactonizing enzyme family protein [Verrucomicrobiota bacterium]
MKIQTIETFLLESSIDEPFAWSQGMAAKRAALICKITTDDGLVGWGEGGGSPSQTIIHDYFAPQLLGEDPGNINKLWHKLFHTIHNDNQAGGFGGGAISCIDIALWDLLGKSVGKSIAELLGGSVREKVSVYATGLYYRDDEGYAKLTAEAESYVEAGYQGMKTKIGGLSVSDDVRRVAAIRDAIGDDLFLMVDANKAYNVSTAIDIGNRLAELDIHWFEEPLIANDVEGYLDVKAGQPLTVAGGEVWYNRFEARDFLARRALDIAQPDVRYIGGITEFRNVASTANAMGIQVNPHVWGSAIMISASISLASTFAPCPYARIPRPYQQEPVMEFDQTPNPIRNDLASITFEQSGGFVEIPRGPGLGLEIDELAVKRFCVRQMISN